MNINEAFPSPFLQAADLPDDGLAVTFTMVSLEIFEGEKNPKALLFFKELEKPMLLNKTNKNSIVEVMGGTETNDWIGRRVTIYPTECDFKGDRVACIRVKLRAPEKPVNGRATTNGGDGWIAAMLRSFAELNVSRQMIEARIGHPVAELNAADREQLKAVHDAMLVRGEAWPKADGVDLWMQNQQGGELVVQRSW